MEALACFVLGHRRDVFEAAVHPSKTRSQTSSRSTSDRQQAKASRPRGIQLLDPEIIEEAMTRAIAQAENGEADSEPERERIENLENDLHIVKDELDRLTTAVLAGADVSTLVEAMRERERRREALQRRVRLGRDLERPHLARADACRVRQELREKLKDWRAMLRAHVPQARQMVRKLITDRIVFTPHKESRTYHFIVTGSLARFFNGHPQALTSPTGHG